MFTPYILIGGLMRYISLAPYYGTNSSLSFPFCVAIRANRSIQLYPCSLKGKLGAPGYLCKIGMI